MQFKFTDIDATYESHPNGYVVVTLKGEDKPSISADSFINAKAAVKARLERRRSQDIEAAWRNRSTSA